MAWDYRAEAKDRQWMAARAAKIAYAAALLNEDLPGDSEERLQIAFCAAAAQEQAAVANGVAETGDLAEYCATINGYALVAETLTVKVLNDVSRGIAEYLREVQ